MLNKILCGTALLAAANLANAQYTADINVGSDSARLALGWELANPENQSDALGGRFLLNGSYQYVDGGDNRDNTNIFSLGGHLFGDAGAQPHTVNVGLGAKAYALDAGDDAGGAVAPGFEVELRLYGYDRIGVGGYAYYAPEILSFGDLEAFLEYSLWADYQIIRNGSLYVGYRQVKAESRGADFLTLDTGAHLGFKLKF